MTTMDVNIDVDYDQDKWLWMPAVRYPGEPGDPLSDPRTWARTYAGAVWTLADAGPGSAADVDRLTVVLTQLAEAVPVTFPGQDVYLYLPDPRRMPLPLYVQTTECQGQREEALRAIVRADDDAVKPPVVETFSTEHLGQGLRSLRYFVEPEEGELGCSLNYAWRIEEHGFDLRLWTSTGDLDWLTQALDDFDTLARTVNVLA